MKPRLAVLGYGRFGRAFGELALDAGLTVRAFDPAAPIPTELRTHSIEELVRECDQVVLALPLKSMRGCIEQLRPFLRIDQVVMDVASVKIEPEAIMAEVLGDEVPWVATHPLFGPSALALEYRPLQAVVCPNSQHPRAAHAARHTYELLGCEVIEQDADTHDRVLARSHALTFFVARGMLAVAGESLRAHGPPSVKAMAQVVESVHSDAAHLFQAIAEDNPYAAEARRDLLRALEGVHRELGARDASGTHG